MANDTVQAEVIQAGEKETKQGPTSLELLTGMWPKIQNMPKDELRQECESWRALSSWLTDELKYYLGHIGHTARIIRRDYKGYLGEFMQPKFTLESLEIRCYEKVYDQSTGKYYHEVKVVQVPMGSVMYLEFIAERYEDVEKTEDEIADMAFSGLKEGQ